MGDSNRELEEIAKSRAEAGVDFYELLGVTFESQAKDIQSKYRKASLLSHPDRFPDDPAAADRFILLGWAKDILLDPQLKNIYDTTRLRRKEKILQNELLDSRRRKLKEDLEQREAAVSTKRKRADDLTDAEKRELEIQRLAEDGKRRRKEMQEKLERQRKEQEASFMEEANTAEMKPAPVAETPETDRTIKVRFVRDGEAAAWDKEKITSMFAKYGKIDSVVMGKDKKIRLTGEKHKKITVMVLIVYTRLHHAHSAVTDAKMDYPLIDSVSWAGKEPEAVSSLRENGAPGNGASPPTPMPNTPNTPNKSFRSSFSASINSRVGGGTAPGTPSFSFSPKPPNFEDITMMRLKQAEKKRLEEQIRKQEAAEEAGEAAS